MMGLLNRKKKEQFKKIESKGEVVEDNPMQEMVKESNEEIEKEADEKTKEVIQIVKELPVQTVRKAKSEDGTLITYMTIEEALTEIMNEEN